jgi:hypothetical protein
MRAFDLPGGTAGSWVSKVGTGILVLYAVVFGSVFLYASLHHEDYSGAPRVMRLFLYVVAPLAAVCLAVALRLLTARVRIRLTLLLTSILIAFYTAEGGIAFFQTPGVRRESAAHGSDTRSKREVIKDLRAEGKRAVPGLRPEVFLRTASDGTVHSILKISGREVLPLGGISDTTTVLCNETGSWVTYEADEHGFNNPKGVWTARPIEVAIVGDSFAHGYCLPTDQHLVSVVRSGIDPTLNLGMAGNGPLLMLASIVEYLPSLKPRHVFWLYCEGNDMSNLEIEKRSQLLLRYLKPGFRQDLAELQETIDSTLTDWIERRLDTREGEGRPLNAKTTVPEFLRLTGSRRLLNLSYEYRLWGDFALFRTVLGRARDEVAAWGGTLHFVYLPSRYQEQLFSDAEAVQQNIVTIASGLNLPVIDIRRVFSEEGVRQSAPRGGRLKARSLADLGLELGAHYSAKGNRLVGETVLRSVAVSR